MAILEIIVLVFLLVFIVRGYFKGFVKQILSFANWILALVAAFALVSPTAAYLQTTDISDGINQRVSDWIVEKGPEFATVIDQSGANEQLSDAIASLGLPKFIADLLVEGIDLSSYANTATYADVLAPSIGAILLTVIAFVGLFIVALLILKIIIHFIDKLFSFGVFGIFNKLLGGVLGGAKAVLLLSIVFLVISIAAGILPSINDWITTMIPSEGLSFSISRYLYENNPLVWIFENAVPF